MKWENIIKEKISALTKDIDIFGNKGTTVKVGSEEHLGFIRRYAIREAYKEVLETYHSHSESTMAEGQQGEGFVWTDELIKEMIYEKAQVPEEYFGHLQKMLDDFKKRKLNDVMVTNGASQEKPDSSTIADTINFLEKIDSSSMSDKTWLAEQNNLRQEGKELRERLTGKEIEEVIVKLKK